MWKSSPFRSTSVHLREKPGLSNLLVQRHILLGRLRKIGWLCQKNNLLEVNCPKVKSSSQLLWIRSGGFRKRGVPPKWLVWNGIHGRSQSKMADLGVPQFQEVSPWGYPQIVRLPGRWSFDAVFCPQNSRQVGLQWRNLPRIAQQRASSRSLCSVWKQRIMSFW